ncbi:MAG: hypothetical protein KGI51_00430, partial [Rhodospirillales bacterium]|nr:hypothetical protein [Rhodospirillales bacterium]
MAGKYINTYFGATYLLGSASNPLIIGSAGTIVGFNFPFLSDYAIVGSAGTTWTVINSGLVTGAHGGVFLNSSGTVANLVGGRIDDITLAAVAIVGLGAVTNAGTISATGGASTSVGVKLGGGGSLDNSGVIAGGYDGALFAGGTVVAVDSGTIRGGHAGVDFSNAQGTLTVAAGGLVAGNTYGVRAGGTSVATIIAAGAISAAATGVAVGLGAAGDRLVLDPGASLSGQARGTTLGSTVEFASGASAGTIAASSGPSFIDFSQVVVDSGANWSLLGSGTVANAVVVPLAGVLSNAGTLSAGVLLQGAYLQNAANAAFYGSATLSGGGTVANYGSFTGASFAEGIFAISGDATIVNGSSTDTQAVLRTGVDVYIKAGGGVLTNFGTMLATAGAFAVKFANSATVVNGSATDTIAAIGGALALSLEGAASDLTNYGSILGGVGGGALFGASGTVSNAGTILGSSGVFISGAGTVTNAGRISGTGASGVQIGSAAVVINSAASGTAVISGASYGVLVAGGLGSVTNDGTISANVAVAAGGIRLAAGGSVINGGVADPSALVYGRGTGIVIASGTGSVANYGTVITGATYTSEFGVFALGTLYLANGSSLDGTAAIRTDGVAVEFGSGTVTNAGTISAGFFYAITATNARITNSGLIVGPTGIIVNSGSIYNSGTIIGTGGSLTNGVKLGGTLTNQGTIIGMSGTAVALLGMADRLILDPGATFGNGTVGGTGLVEASNLSGAVEVLELASAASAGTLAGLGATFVGFNAATVDVGADWTMAGANSFLAAPVVDSGTLINAGTFTGTVLAASGGTANNGIGLGSTAQIVGYLNASGAGATATNSGTVAGGMSAISSGTAVNDGLVSGTVVASSGGTASNGIVFGSTAQIVGYLNASGAGATATNFGTIAGGMSAISSGTVVNEGLVGGITTHGGLYVASGGVLLNRGTVLGKLGFGNIAALIAYQTIVGQGFAPGTLTNGATNDSTALISGYVNGVYLAPKGGVLRNYATIASTGTSSLGGNLASGVRIAAQRDSTTLINGSATDRAAAILGARYGVYIASTIGTAINPVVNYGTISAASVGLVLQNGGTVISSGLIAGGSYAARFGSGGRLILDPGASLVGAVLGSAAKPVLELTSAAQAGTLTATTLVHQVNLAVDPGATWTLAGASDLGPAAGSPGYIVLAGTLVNVGTNIGIQFTTGRSVATPRFVNLGTMSSASTTVYALDSPGNGIQIVNGATNDTTALISNHGQGYAVNLSGRNAPISLTNFGRINVGSNNHSPVLISNQTTVSIFNAGSILGGARGIYSTAATLLLTNTGVISSYSFGVWHSGAGVITNSGTISGGVGMLVGAATVVTSGAIDSTSASGTALEFTGLGTLVLDSDASFLGAVAGGGSQLELASAATSGTLSGLGSVFQGFAGIGVDTGATWTLAGANTLQAGVAVTGAGTLINAGSLIGGAGTAAKTLAPGLLVNDGVILADSGDPLAIAGAVTAAAGQTGTIAVLNAGTVALSAPIAADQTVLFAGTTAAGVLQLSDAPAFAGTIAGFSPGDSIQLLGETATALGPLNANVLPVVLAIGGGTIDLHFDPAQSFAGDTFHFAALAGGAGTAITDTTPCYLAGTRIRTVRGERKVENLKIGDR